MTAALVAKEATAKQLAPIVSVADVGALLGSAMRNAVVDEASNTDAGRQQNKDLRCDSPLT